ncbi:hypothetical protein AgCh_003483 [Apium graveolens]
MGFALRRNEAVERMKLVLKGGCPLSAQLMISYTAPNQPPFSQSLNFPSWLLLLLLMLSERQTSDLKLSPSCASANVSRAGIYQGWVCGTGTVRTDFLDGGVDLGLFEEYDLLIVVCGKIWVVAPSPDCAEFSESGLRLLSLAGVEFFLPPSPDCVEFSESGLRWLSLAGVELFLPPSPDCVEFSESGLRFMVWTKARAKAYITCYSGPSGSDLESSSDSERVEMGKKASTSDSEALTKLSVARISSRKSDEIENNFYYRSIRSGYARQPNAAPGPYNEEEFDRKFVGSIVVKEPYELKEEYAALDHAAQDSSVRAAFQLDPRIKWRWPEPGERIYHRPADGFVPNGELIMLRGLDLFYLPYIAAEGVRTRFRRDVLRGEAIQMIFAFCECLGLPHNNPDMSSSAYSDSLKGLGKAFKLSKKATAGGSGSNASVEEGSQSNVVSRPEADVIERALERDVELEIGAEFENLEDLGPIGEVPDVESRRKKKRLRTLGTKPPRTENFEAGSGSGAGKEKGLEDDGPVPGSPELEVKVARFMAGILPEANWKKMNLARFDATMKEYSRLWGQLGGCMAGSAYLAYNELKGAQTSIAEKDTEISQLRDQIIVKDTSLSGLNKHLSNVTTRAENSEKEVSNLKSELAELRRQMSAVRLEVEVIEEFKRSEDYDKAMANVGAPEITHCWLVAERHIKINPEADWDNFVNEFIKAKD